MRPKAIIALAVIAVILFVFIYIFSDRLIEGTIENMGESIVGAKVEVDNLNFSLADLALSFDRLQVTNPSDTWKNLFETGRVSFDVDYNPLFRKKIVIKDITIADIRVATKRQTDGKLAKKKALPKWLIETKENLERQIAAVPVLNLGALKRKVNVDSLIALFDIESVSKIEAAKHNAAASFTMWQTTISDFKPKSEFQKLEKQVNELAVIDIEGVENLVSTLDKSKRLYNSLNEIKSGIDLKKKSSQEDFKAISSTFSQFDDWIRNDIDRIKSKANLGEFTPQNMGKMLFGDVVVKPTIQVLEYAHWARKYMPVVEKVKKLLSSGKVENPPRFAGQDIRFFLRNAWPEFVMEHIFVSGASHEDTSRAIRVSGEVNGVTNQPRLYGKSLNFILKAQRPNSKAYAFTGEFDHTGDIAKDRFQIKATGIQLKSINLPERAYLPIAVQAKRANVSVKFEFVGDQLDVHFNLSARPVHFEFAEEPGNNDVISKVTHDVFDSIEHLKISASLVGLIGGLKLKVSSNVDDILSKRIQGVIGESVQLARAEIDRKVRRLVEPKKQEALAFFNTHKNQISTEIASMEKFVDGKLAIVEKKKKEIEQKIEYKKKAGIEELTDKVKDIFKKKN